MNLHPGLSMGARSWDSLPTPWWPCLSSSAVPLPVCSSPVHMGGGYGVVTQAQLRWICWLGMQVRLPTLLEFPVQTLCSQLPWSAAVPTLYKGMWLTLVTIWIPAWDSPTSWLVFICVYSSALFVSTVDIWYLLLVVWIFLFRCWRWKPDLVHGKQALYYWATCTLSSRPLHCPSCVVKASLPIPDLKRSFNLTHIARITELDLCAVPLCRTSSLRTDRCNLLSTTLVPSSTIPSL